MKNIEAELRSFISEEQFNKLLDFFKQNAELEKQDSQKTYYFDCEEDLRIQKSDSHSKVWLKKGNIHDNSREEIEIKFPKEKFEQLEKLFLFLGMNIQIKWFRKRNQFNWNGIKVCLDYTKGYGHIIELEKLCSEEEQEKILQELKTKFKELNIEITPREEFEKKFNYYKENWKQLIN